MPKPIWLLASAGLILAACATPDAATVNADAGYIAELPEAVLAIVAPGQNLAAVRIDPTTGCYIYRHDGPVESTFVPLRSTEGRPICTREVDPAAAG
ncbi:MAG: hypothetical protein D6801_04250 [Alphaproteobacteria bacterium]|nr:MAG: hypothetical protein D6801_04250 [Alphaproteobacteria bacterium]